MSVQVIRATICCDGCGKHFKADMDPAVKTAAFPTLFDMALDAVRGGDGTSVQAGKMLCETCTKWIDDFYSFERNPTADEVNEALEFMPE